MSFEMCSNCDTPERCLEDIKWACAMVDAYTTVADENANIIGSEISYGGESLRGVQNVYDKYSQKFKERQCEYDAERLKSVIATIIDSVK